MTNTIRQDVNILGTLSAQGITPELASVILNNVYGVGAIYISTDSTSPASLFGGTWERIQDTFLLASGSTYLAGTSGGSANSELIAHSHTGLNVGGTTIGWGMSLNTNAGTPNTSALASVGETATPVSINANGTTDGVGKNMPPYLAVYMWRRIS